MTLASNKQSMEYSLQGERVPIYETDENGNIIYYTDSDGNKIPMKVGSVIWKKSEVGYKDEAKTIVDETTADYTVKGIADEGMSEDLFLLQRNVK